MRADLTLRFRSLSLGLSRFEKAYKYRPGYRYQFRKPSPWSLLSIYETMDGEGSNFGLASPDLLKKIDRLFTCNVGEYVDLPQLVVVGDQSSGKSSVLEALTNLPFPRESGLCTRFATQITFRRSQETRVSVSVIPAETATEEHKITCRASTANDFRSLDAGSFANIMKQAHTLFTARF
jgi:hypothetical protein